ncbi:TIGR00341 family protein [Porphyromonas uenonis]|uniref:TIGR00341 family protein n=1 Tax=Porphyromonas uenonis TaxID=281920 RepID=UPI0004831908|nr:TIGR00341 family protein [Porphyromonas uenonis]
MPSSENSSPTIDVLKRLVAQHKSARHQHHEPMADELTSCPMTPIYNKVAHEPAADRHLYINRVSSSSDQPSPIKAATAPSQSKVAVTTDQPAPIKAATAPSQSKVAVTTDQPAPSKATNSQRPTANSQQPKASSPQPTANSQQPEENIWWLKAWNWLRKLLDFREDKAGDVATIESLKGDVEFRGTKLWILICAILVASIGLNVNSTAVIIGAMLISPLMGPIIGFGLGFGIADLDLVRKSLRNLALTTLFSILTATIYFLLTPLDQPGSELLGRTEPSLYDVLIAFFGGAAGLIAGSSKSKGQVLPGVAIATALMPPLCTAGFGLATGNWAFFFGAIYLYLINSVFIAFATFVMVRIMRFPMKSVASGDTRKRSYRWITVIAVCTLIPSIYLSIRLVRDSYQEQRAKQFIADHFAPPTHQVIRQSFVRADGDKRPYIDVVLIGTPLSTQTIDSIAALLPSYGLSNFDLQVHQGIDNDTPTDYEQLGGVLLRDLYERSERTASEQRAEIDSLRRTLLRYDYYKSLTHDVSDEARAVFTDISQVRLMPSMEFIQGQDSVLHILVTTPSHRISPAERSKLEQWLQKRTKADDLELILTN